MRLTTARKLTDLILELRSPKEGTSPEIIHSKRKGGDHQQRHILPGKRGRDVPTQIQRQGMK